MADKNYQSELSHLTSLDFDISAIPKQLEKIQADLEQTAREIATGEQYKLKVDVDSQEMVNDVEEIKKKFSGITKDLSDKGFAGEFAKSKDELEKIKEEVKSLAGEYSNLAKVQLKVTSKGKVTGATLTYDDDAGRKIISNYKLQVKYNEEIVDGVQTYDRVWKNTSNNVIDNIKQREIAEEKARQKRESNYKKELANIDNIIQKQKQLIATIQSQPTSKENRAILQEATANLENLNKVREATAKTRIFTDVDQKNVSDYSAKVKDLETSFKATGNGANNFLKTITDKARWLTAFYLINGLKDAFFGSIKTIKETEDAGVELQRVLNEDIAQTQISDQLYKIAQNYGRSFTEVSETAVKFAQTGKSWNETLKATEATMLAVNTAELEVNTATTGLIAVMSQFNLKADEMQSLIDKINITADNFAVTSEKIVAALQRAGSSAGNANLSLEDTIALITTLSEKTGRSGENIGVALNSLLIYTSKINSLDMFAGINKDMDRLVAKYKSGTASIVDVWQGLATTIKTLSLEQQQNLEKSLLSDEDFSNFTNAFEQEATDVAQTIKDTYSTAGTFRQNYFIALLNNLDTYTEAMGKMTQAEGYSLTENEKAMSTLTRQWQQLVEASKELAVQMGEIGTLNVLKFFIDTGKAIVIVTKNIGGLITALSLMLALMVKLKSQKLAQIFSDLALSFNLVKNSANAAAFSVKSLQFAFGWISGAIAIMTSLYATISGVNSASEAMAQASIDRSKEFSQEANKINSLVKEYEDIIAITDDATAKSEQLEEFKNKLIKTYGYEEEAVRNLNGARKEEIDFLNKEYIANVTNAYVEIEDAYEKAKKKIEGGSKELYPTKFAEDYIDPKTLNILKQSLDVYESTSKIFSDGKVFRGFKFYTENLYEQKDVLASLIANENIDLGVKEQLKKQWKNISKEITNSNEAYKEGISKVSEYAIAVKYANDIALVKSKEDYEKLVEKIKEKTDSQAEETAIITKLSEIFPQFTKSIEDNATATSNYTFDLEKLKEVSKGLNEQIDDTQSSFDTLFGIMEEYNSTGTLTADMLQTILSLEGEYSSLLNITADGISLNENETNNLINSKQDLLQKTLATNTAIQLETLAESLLAEQQEKSSQSAGGAIEANDDLATSIYKVLNSATGGAIAMQEFASAVKEYGTGVGLEGDFQAKYEEQSKKILSNYQQIFKEIGEVGKTQSFWQSKTSNASKKANDEAKKALQEQKNLVKERYNEEISKIKEAQEANKKKYNAQIDKLKKVEKENDRIRKKEEFERNRQASLKDLAQAEARSGVEYREQEFDIQEKINDENRKWQEQLEDWELEDRISKLEKLRDAENERLAEQIKKIEKLRDTETKALEEQIKALEGTLAQTAVTSSTQMATAYKDNFIEPVKEETTKVFTNSYDTLLESNTEFAKKVKEIYSINLFEPLKTEFATVFGTDFTDLAEINSKQMYKIYSENFTTKFKKDIKSIFESTLTASNYVLQNNRNQVTYGYQPQGLSTTNYNSNRSMNVVANVNSASGANKLSNDINRIFNNSTLPY